MHRDCSSVSCPSQFHVMAETGMGHALWRPLDLGFVPALAAVGGHFHQLDRAAAGPRQAADLVEAAAGKLLSARRERDDRLRPDLVVQRRDFRVAIEMPEVVVVHVVAVDHLDSPQPLGVEDPFEAGHHQPHRKPLLRPHRLAVHAVGHDAVVHRLGNRHARGALHFLRPFRDEPGCAAFQAALLEQRGQEHAGPFGAARHAVRFLHGLRSPRRSIPRALDEMNAGDGREALQVLHGEGQRTVHQAVDHQTVLPRIDVRKK